MNGEARPSLWRGIAPQPWVRVTDWHARRLLRRHRLAGQAGQVVAERTTRLLCACRSPGRSQRQGRRQNFSFPRLPPNPARRAGEDQGALARSRSRGGLTDGSVPHPAWTKLASMADVTPPWGSYLFSPGPKVADARFHACAPGACRCGCVCLCAVATRCPARSRSRRSLTDGCAPNPAAVCGRPVSRAPTTRRPLPRL